MGQHRKLEAIPNRNTFAWRESERERAEHARAAREAWSAFGLLMLCAVGYLAVALTVGVY